MAAVATTARASDPAQTVTTSARAGDADPGRFARLLGTAQETAGGQPSTDPMAAEHLNRRTATPEQSSPSDKPAVGKPPANKQTVPDARQTAGPAEDSAARKQTLPHASAQNGAAAAAAQTAEPQASLQPASGQSNAEPVPPAAPTVKPGVVLTQPTAEPAQGNLSAQGPTVARPTVPGPAVPRPTVPRPPCQGRPFQGPPCRVHPRDQATASRRGPHGRRQSLPLRPAWTPCRARIAQPRRQSARQPPTRQTPSLPRRIRRRQRPQSLGSARRGPMRRHFPVHRPLRNPWERKPRPAPRDPRYRRAQPSVGLLPPGNRT